MKIKSIIFVLFFSFCGSMFALSLGDFNFSGGVKTGTLFGKQGEYIYSSDDTFYCSYLEWNENPLVRFEIDGQADYKNFFVNADFSYYLPLSCGKMYDSDYTSTFKKNYCILENKSIFAVDFDFSFYYKFNLTDAFALMPYLQGQYDYRSFTTDKGYGWFGGSQFTGNEKDVPWNDSSARKAKSVSGIDFYRENYLVFGGIGMEYKYKNWKFNCISLVSPYAKIISIDYHRDENNNGVEEDYYIYEVQHSVFSRFKEILCVEYELNQHVSFNLEGLFFFGGIVKGSMWTDHDRSDSSSGIFAGESDWKKLSQKCGADVFESTISLGVTVR